MTFRVRLFITFALVVLPLVGSAAYFHYSHYYENRDAAIADQRTVAELLASSVDVFVQRTVSTQRSVGQALVVAHWHEPSATRAYLRTILRTTQALESIALATPSGVIVEAAPPAFVGQSIADTSYFARIRGGAQWAVSGSTRETLPGRGGVVIATAIRDDRGRLKSVVVSGVGESRIGAVVQPIARSEARLFVTDRRGHAVYISGNLRASAADRDFSRFGLVREALAGHSASSADFVLPDGVATVGAVAPIASIGWAAGAFVPRSQVLGPVVAGSIRDTLITATVVVLAVILASLLTRRVTRQVSALAQAAERLGQGDLHVRAAAPGIAELESLARTLNAMADAVQQRDTQVRMALAREHKAGREASALYGITDSLIGSLLLSDRLQALASGMAAIAGTAVCVFYITEDDRLVVGAVSGSATSHTESFAERKIRYSDLGSPVGDALRSGSPTVVQAPSPELSALAIGNTKSALILPVRSDSDLLGAAVLYTPDSDTRFSDDVIATQTTLAQLASRAIVEARSFEREQRIASVLQHTILGRVPHGVGRAEIATGYFAVRDEAEIGGDLYDVTVLPNGLLGILIADVAGKGLKAATNTAMAKYLTEGFAFHETDPSKVLANVNDVVAYSAEEWTFTTAFFGTLDTQAGVLTYASAGHPPPLLRRSGGSVEWLDTPPGPPLGVQQGAQYPSSAVLLRAGDVLVGYTDGVIEARRDGRLFGSEGLEELARSFSDSPDEVVDLIHRAAAEFTGGSPQDDIALIAIKLHG